MFLKETAKQVYSDLFKGKIVKSKTEGTSCSPFSENLKRTQGVLLLFKVGICFKLYITSMKTEIQGKFLKNESEIAFLVTNDTHRFQCF